MRRRTDNSPLMKRRSVWPISLLSLLTNEGTPRRLPLASLPMPNSLMNKGTSLKAERRSRNA
jgi:hypothetical protein